MNKRQHLPTNKPNMYLCTRETFKFRVSGDCKQVTGQCVAREPFQIALTSLKPKQIHHLL